MSRAGGINTYGFDFLKSEHTLDGAATSAPPPPPLVRSTTQTTSFDPNVALKPDLEKQFDVIHFLQAHRSSGCLAPSVIYKATGIDLERRDESVAKMLERNPKIRVEHVPDPENPSLMVATYAYQAKYNHVRDRTTLLAQINRCRNGVAVRDLIDAYDGVEKDLAALVTAGDVLGVANPEDKDKILFPRGEVFLVELDGIVTLHQSQEDISTPSPPPPLPPALQSTARSMTDDEVVAAAMQRAKLDAVKRKRQSEDCHVLELDMDPLCQIRRGEAVNVGGQWFRVSSAVRDGVPLNEQPARAQAPLSVTSLSDLSKKNDVDGYIRPFTDKFISIDDSLSQAARDNLLKAKTARERLHKLAGGRGLSGGAAAQLLSSHAHATNPATLVASFVSSLSGNSSGRKRPTLHKAGGMMNGANGANNAQHDQARTDAQAAKEAVSDPALTLYSHVRRHGCTKDVRDMYLSTRKWIPENEMELYKVMLDHKLLEPGEAMRRPRLPKKANVDNDGKPKKRRYYERKNQRRTNYHLDGTDIGAVLARATERQKQGKSVGDGGM